MTGRPFEHARRAVLLIAAALGLCVAAGLGSCSSRLGWGVVLWSAPEGPLAARDVVTVYIRSNIQKLYVVGVPGSSKKIELPLWQLEFFPSKSRANARVKAFGPYVSLYMVAARDGVPLRESPTNSTSSRRVFRLREGQSVKILDKVAGETVTTGGAPLPGEWYLALADDGTRGYVFSYALRIYDESKEKPPETSTAAKDLSGRIDLIFSKSWRPEYFQEMIDDGRVDLDLFTLGHGLFTDAVRRQVRIELPAASKIFNYDSISEQNGVYIFEGTLLRIRIEGERRLGASWTEEPSEPDEEPAPQGAAFPAGGAPAGAPPAGATASGPAASAEPVAGAGPETAAPPLSYAGPVGADGRAAFVILAVEPRDVIRAEDLRRQKLLEAFADRAGSVFASDLAGRLTVSKSRRFAWADRGFLPIGFLPVGAGEAGEISFRLFLDPALEADWDGAFSLRFDAIPGGSGTPGMDRSAWIDFLYRLTPEGLAIQLASTGASGIVVSASEGRFDPVVLLPQAQVKQP